MVKDHQTNGGTSLLASEKGAFMRKLYGLTGKEILKRILDMDDPQELIRAISSEDFYWLIKKIGEDSCVPILELASVVQWQYVLDLELWKKDRLDISHTYHWLNLFQQANCRQLTRWLFSEAETLAYYHFFKTLEVIVIHDRDEVIDLPEGFFSLDGVFYIRVIDPQYRETVENIIRVMANEDLDKYQALLRGLAGVLPAEVEEDLYRLRNLRLAEHGFLPFEEAMVVYSPLDPAFIKTSESQPPIDVTQDQEIRVLAPVLPLAKTGTQNLFLDVVDGIRDPLFLDRLRLEFAGLANQILSADGLIIRDTEALIGSCKRAARIVNLAIEKASGSDPVSAQNLLKRHSLISLFRVGFGMVLQLKWEAEQWLKASWFYGQGLNLDFWGDKWGGILSGLLAKRPQYYIGSSESKGYRDFEWLSDLGECIKILRGVMVLDGLLERLAESYRIRNLPHTNVGTCHSFLFNLWGRLLLNMEPSFSGISLEQAKTLLGQLRGRDRGSPYRMTGFETKFVKDFMSNATNSDPEAASTLEEALSQLWKEFQEEYERVSLSDLDARYSNFLSIETHC